jgi:hypothetical protein
MRRTLLALCIGAAVAGGGVAWPQAGGSATGAQWFGTARNRDAIPDLTQIDLHLRGALDDARVLWEQVQLGTARRDLGPVREDLGDLDRSLAAAHAHLDALRARPNGTPPSTERLDEVAGALGRAQALASRLQRSLRAGAPATQLSSQVVELYGALRSADDAFAPVAAEQRLVRVDRIAVPERLPVSGHDADDTAAPPPTAPRQLDDTRSRNLPPNP